MAIKHLEEYYKKVCDDYTEMLQTLTDMEEAFNQNLVSDTQMEQLKQMIAPLKNNYMTLSWVMHLLYQPSRKEKQDGYERRTTKFKSGLDPSRSRQGVLNENKEVLNKLKNGILDGDEQC
jgi:hypothetical protein